jgi:uncharacterized protein YuzE
MKISYDEEIDALYIHLIEGKHECRTVRLSEEVALNIGADEKLVGIEVLDAKEIIGSGRVPRLVLEGIEFSGVQPVIREGPAEYRTTRKKTQVMRRKIRKDGLTGVD